MLKHAYLIAPTRRVLHQNVSRVRRFLSVNPRLAYSTAASSRPHVTLAKPDGYEESDSKATFESHSDDGKGKKTNCTLEENNGNNGVAATVENATNADVASSGESLSERLKSGSFAGAKTNSNSSSSSGSGSKSSIKLDADVRRSSRNKSHRRTEMPSNPSIPDVFDTSNVSILKEENFREVLKEAQEAMANAQSDSPVSLMRIRERVKEWRSRKLEEEEGEEEVDRDWAEAYRDGLASTSRSAGRLTIREKGSKSRASKRNGIYRKSRNSRTSTSRFLPQKPPIDPTNPYAHYVLPILKQRESQRIARMRQDDVTNLSFLEAEAKLGLTSELYNAAPFGRSRGGKGKTTERWKKFLAVQRFERETGEKAMWVRWNVEPNGRNKKERTDRGTERKEEVRGKDSFAKVWGGLASSIHREPAVNAAQEV